MSMVRNCFSRLKASQTNTELWRSRNGKVVDARYKVSTALSFMELIQALTASTAMVMVSSSQLHILRSPSLRDLRFASNQMLASAIAFLINRPLGI